MGKKGRNAQNPPPKALLKDDVCLRKNRLSLPQKGEKEASLPPPQITSGAASSKSAKLSSSSSKPSGSSSGRGPGIGGRDSASE